MVDHSTPIMLVTLAQNIFGQRIPFDVATSFLRGLHPKIKPLFFTSLLLLNDRGLRKGNIVDLSVYLSENEMGKGFSSPADLDEHDSANLIYRLENRFPPATNSGAPLQGDVLKKQFDKEHYALVGGELVSGFNSRLKVGTCDDLRLTHDCGRTQLESLIYIPSDKLPIYIVDDHNWVLYCWAEAAQRGDILPNGNTLLHLDDHKDAAKGIKSGAEPRPDLLTLYGLLRLNYLASCVFDMGAGLPVGLNVDDFISTAFSWGLVADLWFFKGWMQFAAAFPESMLSNAPPEMERIREALSAGYAGIAANLSGRFKDNYEAFLEWNFQGKYSEHETPSFHPHYVHPKNRFRGFKDGLSPQQLILDIDVDVDRFSNANNVEAFVGMLKERGITPGLVTIALSPPENHHYLDVVNPNYLEKAKRAAEVVLDNFGH